MWAKNIRVIEKNIGKTRRANLSENRNNLARLVGSAGNHAERKQLLDRTLRLERKRGDDVKVASTLRILSDANRMVHLFREGIDQAQEALEIYERIGDTNNQGDSLIKLAWSLYDDRQLDAAEEVAYRAIELLPEKGQGYRVCQSHRLLGNVYRSKGQIEEGVQHLETALEIASRFNWNSQSFWIHHSLAEVFLDEDDFENVHLQIDWAKSHAVNEPYLLGRAVLLQADAWRQQGRLEDARTEALCAFEIFQKLGAADETRVCKGLLQGIEERWPASDESDSSSELLEVTPSPTPTNSPLACYSSTSDDAP